MGIQFPTDHFGPFAFAFTLMEELTRLWLWGYFKLFHGIRWRGLSNIPKTGSGVIASNHLSFYDPCLVGALVRRRQRFMAFHKYFKIPGVGALFRFWGAFPVNPAKADRSAYENSLRVLRDDGDVVIIFAEGARSRSGTVNPIKPGAARIALAAGAWVVPAVVLGPERAWPHTACVPRLFRPLNVKYYPAIRVARPAAKADLAKAVAEVNRRIETHWRRRIRAWARLQRRRGKSVRLWA